MKMRRTLKVVDNRLAGWGLSTLVLAGALSLGGCQENPFDTTPGRLSASKPAEHPVGKPWGIDVPEQMEFVEGRKDEYAIQAYVPSPAKPVLAMADLPVGARFNSTTGVLTWTPDYSAGNDSKDPSTDLRTYRARVLLSSTLEPYSVVEKMVLLVVHNVSRPVDLEWQQGLLQIREGAEFKARVKVKSLDYPSGPFGFYVSGLPSGLEIEKDPLDAATFQLRITPPLDTVTHSDDVVAGGFQSTWNAKVLVVDPSGKRTETPVDFRVLDSRQNAIISAPAMVQGVADVRFQISAEDPNREEAPSITVEAPAAGGTVTVDEDKDGLVARRSIRWNNIPEVALGKTHQFKIKACVYGSKYAQDRCVTHLTDVKLEAQLLKEPTFDRSQWQVGEMKFLREGETLRVRLPIQNLNPDNYPMSISVEPASMRTEVSFVGNEVLLKPMSKGFKQFTVVARLAQGLSRTEGFAFEALPRTWSKVLVLGDGMRDPEIAGTLKILPGAQVVNPVMQELTERVLALRETVVIGTSLLQDAQGLASADLALQRAKNIVIQSPKLDALPATVWQKLSQLGLSARGRFSAVLGPNVPQLNKVPVSPASGSGLSMPMQSVYAGGGLTQESANPMILAVTPASSCKTMVRMLYQPNVGLPAYELPVIARCDAPGKRWVVSGVEWADLAASSPADQSVVSRWFDEVLK